MFRKDVGALAVAVIATTIAACLMLASTEKNAIRHPKRSEANEIENHILQTQKPAKSLGIRVKSCTETTLSLQAPLSLNHNVHGTAFAGSLYSVGVLCSYYLGRAWMLRHGLTQYELVAKAGTIRYERPVKSTQLVATSSLPAAELLSEFRMKLEGEGKATITIDGSFVLDENKPACEYSIEVCAFLPRENDFNL